MCLLSMCILEAYYNTVVHNCTAYCELASVPIKCIAGRVTEYQLIIIMCLLSRDTLINQSVWCL